jgi:hypothetical protein
MASDQARMSAEMPSKTQRENNGVSAGEARKAEQPLPSSNQKGDTSIRFVPANKVAIVSQAPPASNASTPPSTQKNTGGAGKRRRGQKTKEQKLEENKLAARESRKRKKAYMEEMQRSLVFYSKSNATLKAENEELKKRLADAESRIQELSGLLNGSDGQSSSQQQLNGSSTCPSNVIAEHQSGSSSESLSSDSSSNNGNDKEAKRKKAAKLESGVKKALREAEKGMETEAAIQISQLANMPLEYHRSQNN